MGCGPAGGQEGAARGFHPCIRADAVLPAAGGRSARIPSGFPADAVLPAAGGRSARIPSGFPADAMLPAAVGRSARIPSGPPADAVIPDSGAGQEDAFHEFFPASQAAAIPPDGTGVRLNHHQQPTLLPLMPNPVSSAEQGTTSTDSAHPARAAAVLPGSTGVRLNHHQQPSIPGHCHSPGGTEVWPNRHHQPILPPPMLCHGQRCRAGHHATGSPQPARAAAVLLAPLPNSSPPPPPPPFYPPRGRLRQVPAGFPSCSANPTPWN